MTTSMTRPLRLVMLLCIAALLALSGTAAAEDGPGTKAVRKANETISNLLRQKASPGSAAEKRLAAKVTQSVRDFLDVDELGREAMRDHWKTLSADQQNQFLSVLRELIEKNYIKGLRANLEYQVVYTGETQKGNTRVVSTKIETTRRGRPYTVSIDYVLRKDGSSWRTFDVITDGVGLVENYRAMFNKLIAKKGFDGLLERMRKKAASID